MKNLYIHGHFMSDNYGDFLIYYETEKIVKKYKYNYYSTNIDFSYDDYCKVIRVSVKYALKNSDLAIFTGGGYFAEPDSNKIKWNIKCLIKHIVPAYILYKRKIPYVIVGVEVGPVSLFINRILLKKIFNGATKVSVRNQESKNYLLKLKVKNDIEVVPDLIMGMTMDEKKLKGINISDNLYKSGENIFVHLTSDIELISVKNVIEDLKKYQAKHNNVHYIFGCDQEKSTQKEKVEKIFNNFDNGKNKILYYTNPWYLTKVLENMDAVITDKLHVGIVATKYKKEVICIAKDPKSIRFYNMIGRSEWAMLLKNVKENDILYKLEKLKFKNIDIDNKLYKQANLNKKIIEDFLKDN